LTQIEITLPDPEWKPNDLAYLEEESLILHKNSSIMQSDCHIFLSAIYDEGEVISAFAKMALTTGKEERVISSTRTDNVYSLAAEKLSRIW
jgi:hypothetical protein